MNTLLNWSSGKDAALAYAYLSRSEKYKITHLLTTLNEDQQRIMMHGVPKSLLQKQADAMNLPLEIVSVPPSLSDDVYQKTMSETLGKLKARYEIATAAFGDIFLEDLKAYREKQLQQIGFKAVFPLWQKNTRQLIGEIEQQKIDAVIVCVDAAVLGKEFLGRKIDGNLLNDLPANVDPCGENGEYHSFVFNAPFFRQPVNFEKGHATYKTYPLSADTEKGFYFLDIY